MLALVAVFATAIGGGRDEPEESGLIGEIAPALKGVTLDGGQFDLDRQRGRWVLVNFFATWCPPCVQEHPELVRFAERSRGAAQVVSVSYDANERDALQAFFDERGGDWPVVVGDVGRIALDFGVKKLPESFLVDPQGVVVAKINGGVTAAEIEQLIADAS